MTPVCGGVPLHGESVAAALRSRRFAVGSRRCLLSYRSGNTRGTPRIPTRLSNPRNLDPPVAAGRRVVGHCAVGRQRRLTQNWRTLVSMSPSAPFRPMEQSAVALNSRGVDASFRERQKEPDRDPRTFEANAAKGASAGIPRGLDEVHSSGVCNATSRTDMSPASASTPKTISIIATIHPRTRVECSHLIRCLSARADIFLLRCPTQLRNADGSQTLW